MVVSASPFQHMKGKPDVKYVANIHGNEAVSREMALHLIEVNTIFNWFGWPIDYTVNLTLFNSRCVVAIKTAPGQELQRRQLHPLAAGRDEDSHLAQSQSRRIRSG